MREMPGVHIDQNRCSHKSECARTELGIKLADCAALCGIGINTLSRIENGNANCTLAAVFSVLKGLGIKLTSKELMLITPPSTEEDEWV
jgi:transcriptional regulator with XRE-family HTH domain